MRRSNIRIAGIEERPGSSSQQAVANVIREVLQMDRNIKVDRSHRTLTVKRPGHQETTQVIIAKLHHDRDAAEIVRRAQKRAPVIHNGHRIAFFPDYTASVPKARATFMEVRKVLQGRRGVRYGLLYPARLRLTYQNEEKEFLDPQKAMEYIQNTIVPTETPE